VTQFQWLVAVFGTCVHREQNAAFAFLREENRLLKGQLHGRPVRLRDHERRRLAAIGHRLGRRTLAGVATIATPDTILRWYRELVVGQRTYAGRRRGRPGVHAHIRSLILRMALENATWGYTRIQGAMKNLGYRVGRSTIARILKQHGIPPSPHRSMTWRTFVRAHWPALLDFLITEASLIRGLVILCAASVIRPHARRVYPAVPRPRRDEHILLDQDTSVEDRHRWRAPTRVAA
jgi:putative transposase